MQREDLNLGADVVLKMHWHQAQTLLTRAGENNPIHTGVLLNYQTETEWNPKPLSGPGTGVSNASWPTKVVNVIDCLVSDIFSQERLCLVFDYLYVL